MIATLTSSSNEAAWRTPAREGEPTIEDRIKWLLYKLKLAHDANAERDPVSRHVSNMIASTWRGFFDTASNSAAAGYNLSHFYLRPADIRAGAARAWMSCSRSSRTRYS